MLGGRGRRPHTASSVCCVIIYLQVRGVIMVLYFEYAPGAKIHVENFCGCLYGYNKGLHAPYMVGLATYMFCSTHMRHEK